MDWLITIFCIKKFEAKKLPRTPPRIPCWRNLKKQRFLTFFSIPPYFYGRGTLAHSSADTPRGHRGHLRGTPFLIRPLWSIAFFDDWAPGTHPLSAWMHPRRSHHGMWKSMLWATMEPFCVDGPGGRVGQRIIAPTAAQQPRNTRGTIEHAKRHPELFRNQFGAHLQKMLSGTIACTMQISAYYI